MMFWAIIRYRKRDDRLPRQTKYNVPLEIVYTIIPFLFVASLFYRVVVVEDYVNKETPNPDVTVRVDAFQWNWQFDYYDNGKVMTYADGSPVNTVGSDSEIPVLVIPVDQTVRFIEHSDDVIHAFWVPEFLFKRDNIPSGSSDTSRDNQFEITATTTGAFVGRCAELCGTYHSQMNFEVRIVSDSDYKAYVTKLASIQPTDPQFENRQAVSLAAITDPKLNAPKAITTYPFATKRTQNSASIRSGS
jgi:cytochrome c oxidase subunit 2